METRISKELRAVMDDAIAEYKDVFSDCTNKDILNALLAVMEEYV